MYAKLKARQLDELTCCSCLLSSCLASYSCFFVIQASFLLFLYYPAPLSCLSSSNSCLNEPCRLATSNRASSVSHQLTCSNCLKSRCQALGLRCVTSTTSTTTAQVEPSQPASRRHHHHHRCLYRAFINQPVAYCRHYYVKQFTIILFHFVAYVRRSRRRRRRQAS